MTLVVPSELFQQIERHCQDGYPSEVAGLILGRADVEERQASRLLPLPNRFEAGDQHRRYRISAADMLAAEDAADALGLLVIGVFHSHPDHPAQASAFDREWALPWLSYLITSVRHGRAVESNSWRLKDDRSTMIVEPLRVVDTLEAK